MRKFLVVNMNYMGDALLTTPALAALREEYPDAQIDTVVGAGSAAEALRDSPYLNSIIARTARGSWGRCAQLFTLLREGRYTDAIILPPLPAYAATAFFAQTPRRIGQARRGMDRFLTELRPTQATHMADAMLDTMPLAALRLQERRRLYVTVPKVEMDYAETMLAANGIDFTRPLMAVNVGATRPQKRWFAESFAQTLDLLPDLQTVIVGSGDHDEALAQEIAQFSRIGPTANLIGKTTVKQLAAVLSRADVLLSADSGPMHLATAVGIPTVALFGSTDPAATGPYDGVSKVLYLGLSCAPCGNHPTCDGRFDCMRDLSPVQAARAVRSLLAERRAHTVLPVLAPDASATLTKGHLREPLPARPALQEQAPTEKISRILIATKFRFIGDTLLAIPIFRAARRLWPDAHIALLTGKSARLLLQNNPYLDEIIEFDPYNRDKGLPSDLRLVRQLRRGKFDLCLSLNRSFHSALIPYLGGARIRAGFVSEGRAPLLNRKVAYDRDKSEIACYFDVLRSVARNSEINPELELWISEAERQQAEQTLHDKLDERLSDVELIGMQPGASLPGKQWPPERYAQAANALLIENPKYRLVVVGGPDEKQAAQRMLASCTEETRRRSVNFTGSFDLRGSLAILSRLNLFLGNDTALMHSAVALDIPTVALFGPTNPRKWGNYGLSHRVLEACGGKMDDITVDEAVQAAKELLARVRKDTVGTTAES